MDNFHAFAEQPGSASFPQIDPDAARIAVLYEDGRETFINGVLSAYDARHSNQAAVAEIGDRKAQLSALAGEAQRTGRRLRFTRKSTTLTTVEKVAHRPWQHVLAPVFLIFVALIALYLSNFVLAAYIVRSGADLYAADPEGARLFAMTAVLAAFGIKVFERWLPHDSAKAWYRGAFFAVGLGSFVLWALMASIVFAPETGPAGAWLLASGSNTTANIVLVLTHVLGDVAWGYLIFSGATDIALGAQKRIEVPNLRYAALVDDAAGIQASIAQCREAIAAAENYLTRIASGREAVRAQAELQFNLAYQEWEQAEAMAIASGRAGFLKTGFGSRTAGMRMLPAITLAGLLALSLPAAARTLIAVLPPDYGSDKAPLIEQLGTAVSSLGQDDRLLVYTARPVAQLATIAVPNDPKAQNRAWVKHRLADQFLPMLRYIAGLPGGASTEPPGNLMIPNVLDEIGRNIIPSLPEKKAEILLLGSLLYYDPRDGHWSMTRRYSPSDGLLAQPMTESPFGIAGSEKKLAGATVHLCWPDGQRHFATAEYEARVRRFWSLWITGQSGRVATISYSLATCFERFVTGKADGQTEYTRMPNAKPEMLQAPPPKPVVLPLDTSRPGAWFMRDDVPISTTPPATSVGVAWVGLKWTAPCDIDLYARATTSSPWLSFRQVRSDEGFFNKDYLSATGREAFEYIQFAAPIDLGKAEIAINLYSGSLPTPPEGVIRVWFEGRVYEAPWKLEARYGNRGAPPIKEPHWLRIDLRKVVGLPTS